MARKCSSSTVDRSICLPTAQPSRDEHCALTQQQAHRPRDLAPGAPLNEDVLVETLGQSHVRLPVPALRLQLEAYKPRLRWRGVGELDFDAVFDGEPALEERRALVAGHGEPRPLGCIGRAKAHEDPERARARSLEGASFGRRGLVLPFLVLPPATSIGRRKHPYGAYPGAGVSHGGTRTFASLPRPSQAPIVGARLTGLFLLMKEPKQARLSRRLEGS
jgi:hypothetical protein